MDPRSDVPFPQPPGGNAMFRPHDAELARSEERADRNAATAKGYATHSDEWFAEVRILDLERTARLGLMDCYAGFPESLFDFWPGFAWEPGAMRRQVRMVLADPRFPAIEAGIRDTFGFDIRAELESGLRD